MFDAAVMEFQWKSTVSVRKAIKGFDPQMSQMLNQTLDKIK